MRPKPPLQRANAHLNVYLGVIRIQNVLMSTFLSISHHFATFQDTSVFFFTSKDYPCDSSTTTWRPDGGGPKCTKIASNIDIFRQ